MEKNFGIMPMTDFKFNPDDFEPGRIVHTENISLEYAAKRSNEKLQKWLSKATVVYTRMQEYRVWQHWHHFSFEGATHKALLIKIESIKKCDHPKDKVHENSVKGLADDWAWICECGAQVKPVSFEECE